MSVRCSVCKHSNRAEIDQLLVAGESLRSVADRFGLHYSSLSRHKRHISQQIGKVRALQEFSELQQGKSILQQIEDLHTRALDLLVKAENAGDIRTAIQAIRESRNCLELLGKATGQLTPETILIQVEPVLNTLVLILKEEILDNQILERVAERLKTIETK